MKEIYIGKNETNQRLDKFLRKYMPKASLSFIYKMLRKKNIKVNNQKAMNTYILQQGDSVQIYFSDETLKKFKETKNIPRVEKNFSIIYEDENILLVDKPSGLLIHGDKKSGENTLVNQVIKYLYDKGSYDPQREKTFVPASVNRLDRNTSGLVIFGKNYLSVQTLNKMIRDNYKVQKYYLAMVMGTISKETVLKGYLIKDERLNQVKLLDREIEGSKFIHTIVKPIKTCQNYSLVEVEIVTGRSHQIRLHLAGIGNPIIGDTKYGDNKVNRNLREKFQLNRQFLHGYKLYFNDSIDHLDYLKKKIFTCSLPKDLARVERALIK